MYFFRIIFPEKHADDKCLSIKMNASRNQFIACKIYRIKKMTRIPYSSRPTSGFSFESKAFDNKTPPHKQNFC